MEQMWCPDSGYGLKIKEIVTVNLEYENIKRKRQFKLSDYSNIQISPVNVIFFR